MPRALPSPSPPKRKPVPALDRPATTCSSIAASQAYARRFGKDAPDETRPSSTQMQWLSRGLFEALVGFIGRAAGPDAADYRLRAMLYEFHYLAVGKAFGAARRAGADVDIRY